jgi:hypothetical protein
MSGRCSTSIYETGPARCFWRLGQPSDIAHLIDFGICSPSCNFQARWSLRQQSPRVAAMRNRRPMSPFCRLIEFQEKAQWWRID